MIAAIAVLGPVMAAALSARQGESANRFWIGAVDRTGSVTPVGLYDGTWRNPWPIPDSFRGKPRTAFAEIPLGWWGGQNRPVGDWRLLTLDGDVRRIRLIEAARREGSCRWYWRLATDYVPSIDAQDAGIASDAETPLASFEPVEPTSDEWKRIHRSLRPRLTPGAPAGAGWPPPTLVVRATRGTLGGMRVYHAEWKALHPSGGTRWLASGWMLETATALSLAGDEFGARWTEENDIAPLGAFVADGEMHVLARVGHRDGTHYEIQRIRATGVTIMVTKEASQC